MAVALVEKIEKIVGYATEGDRWAAVVGRDQGADGAFYYSVRTTGV